MAANPNLPPDERHLRDDHAHVVLTQKRTNPWPVILAIIAAAVLIRPDRLGRAHQGGQDPISPGPYRSRRANDTIVGKVTAATPLRPRETERLPVLRTFDLPAAPIFRRVCFSKPDFCSFALRRFRPQ